MAIETDDAIVEEALSQRFLSEHPLEAAKRLELMPEEETASLIAEQPVAVGAPVLSRLSPGLIGAVMRKLPGDSVAALFKSMEAGEAAVLLSRTDEGERETYLALLDGRLAAELREILSYPYDSAGQLMDTQVTMLRGDTAADAAVETLRRRKSKTLHSLKVVDDAGRLTGTVEFRDLVLADPETPLSALAASTGAVVNVMDPREEVVARLESFGVAELPVIDLDGRLLGVIRQAELLDALKESATVDIQTMVGASRDERALSSSWFAFRKRMPWLQINLLTAFLAASVVGLFEDTIAKYTALAILLPVVAGQSGNAGAQALAVTMRALALREIRVGHWFRVTRKELNTGFWNGVSIAATCAIGVYFWSGNAGLVLIIAMSMVISMVAAGIAGAMVPITLARLRQDPAVASSIILTTVTDVVGFFSFLGIATLLSGMLSAG